ncbi:TPA: hypothetical protein L6B59_18455 [Pseudomonas aeruginosa]|nr:hypothetical protein [Klebsiella pneumoniae]PBZ01471.1 hypothetical protein CJT42_20855 [Pseudomonas aeruginosa]QNF25993.1 hypothetical protein FT673_13480 [Aeromonas hydrophila]EIW8690590.1 hypothetical protein [Klebsiella pneumoniae]RWY18461.1 hypothetical protein EQH76_29090 [Pseudomonas aeruginosa]
MGKAVNSLVLSGNRRLVLSGNKSSCYQATKSAANLRQRWIFRPSNIPNLNSLTFSREALFRWTTTQRHQTQKRKTGFPTRRAAP